MTGWRRSWPLRHRLLAAILVLSATALTGFAVAGVLLLERSLVRRVDVQLADMTVPLREKPPPKPRRPPGPREVKLPTEFHIAFHDGSGTLLREVPDASEGPALSAAAVVGAPDGPFTVDDRNGHGQWRVLVVSLPNGDRAVAGMSLESTRSAVNQMLVIEATVGVLVLGVLGGLAWGVVRLGLRPLTRMERTAMAIADGEIDRRVGDTDPRTEAGCLGRALNTMLGRLGQALHERERSEERLRRFVADASHELRTPLTSIRGFARLYHHGPGVKDPAAERVLERIEGEAERMGRLVEDLLLLARLDRVPTPEMDVVDMHVLAGDVVHAAHARDCGRAVRLDLSDYPVTVKGDERRLHQVIGNVVGNALTHTPDGTPVRVSLDRVWAGVPAGVHTGSGPAPGADTVVVEVSDEGSGIAAEHLPHVFDRFYRADADRSRGTGGAGLGLAIAAALVQAHGGRMEVSSEAGAGTSFRIVLPFTSG
ncbi:HAMP domain-containing sensor histidine kinase [Actinomadura meridiana]|uniref:histidine kinase n=1 Tax=Actinomadura meridiana TaxID=559626 RepID=A0ABP8CJ54_9ACTN